MRLNVEGMTCGHCERSIQRAVAQLGGAARIDLAGRTVEVDGVADEAAVRRAIEDAGYTVTEAPVAPSSSGCCSSRAR